MSETRGFRPSAAVIHVGLNKTGTTWLQRDVFPHVPDYEYVTKRRNGPEVLATVRRLQYGVGWQQGSLLAALERSSSTKKPLLFSEEAFTSTLRYRCQRQLGKAVARLAAELPDARILIVVRRQAELIRSSHRQYVKLGGSASLARFCSGEPLSGYRFAPELFDLDQTVTHFETHFRDVEIIPYELFLEDRTSSLADLFSFLDRPMPSGITAGSSRANISLGWSSTTILRLANWVGTVGGYEPGEGFEQPYRSPAYKVLQQVERRCSLGPAVLRREQALLDQLQASYTASNRALAARRGLPLERLGYFGASEGSRREDAQ